MRPALALRAAFLGLAALAVAGCTVFPEPDPVQLYRFGATDISTPEAPADGGEMRPISMRRVVFPEAVRGDRILSVTGAEAAYVGGARWVTPADALFTESLTNAFTSRALHSRLIAPRELSRSALSLDVDVRTFEARYARVGATPVIHVTARGRIMRLADREIVGEQVFAVTRPASANRVAAIVEAFDGAVGEISDNLVQWTDGVARDTPEGEWAPRGPGPRTRD